MSEATSEASVTPAVMPPAESPVVPESPTLPENGSAETPPPRVTEAMARLAKKEALLLEKQRSLSTRETQVQNWLNELQSTGLSAAEAVSTLKELMAAKESPDKALALAGWDWQKVADFQARQGQPDPLHELRSEVQTLKASLQQREAQQQQLQQQAAQERQQAAEKSVLSELSTLIRNGTEEFELLNQIENAPAIVFDYLKSHYQQTYDPVRGTGEVLPYKQACEAIEAYYTTEFKKFLTAKKFSSMVAANSATTEAEASSKRLKTPSTSKASLAAKPKSNAKSDTDRLRNAMALWDNHVSKQATKKK